MNRLYLAFGILLLGVALLDLLWTTLWVEGGAGPVTTRSMAWTWALLRRVGARNSTLLTLSGPFILLLSLGTWLTMIWAGWTLLFASGDGALVGASAPRQVSWSDWIYYAGYTIFTLGNGDFVPRGGRWQLATTLASANGMLVVTLSVTYVLSVLGAVTQKRSFASGISGLGRRSDELVVRGWDGESFGDLGIVLDTTANQLETLTSNHKAYPILHYFYTASSEQAPTTSVAVLDEALTLLRFGVADAARPNELVLTAAARSVQRYLDTLESTYIEPAADTPPDPSIAPLRQAGIPTVSDEEFTAEIEQLDERRRILFGLVAADERTWPTSTRK